MIDSLIELGDSYTFAILADPQLSGKEEYSGDWTINPRLNYQQYYRAIQDINELQPAFVLINGDLVGNASNTAQYRNFVNLTKLIEVPVFLTAGNHDIPPYTNFLQAQQDISGFQSLYYSFDVGQWHYVVLPSAPSDYDPEPMLEWLAADMAANKDRNTMVFTHYHFMPQGLTQLEFYTQNPRELRTQIMDEVLRYGNTKYWYAGHVHNGIQASVKTAWEYRGAKFITAPTIVTPRGFGEEYATFRQGLSRGGYFMTVDVDQTAVSVVGRRTEQKETFTYPDQFQTFSSEVDPRWFNRVPDFAPQPFTNGSFETALKGWYKVWRYQADSDPRFVTRVSPAHYTEGSNSLMMQVRSGQTKWKGDELTEIYQVVEAEEERFPVLSLDYYVDQLSTVGGGYIRIHAYDDNSHHSTMVFHFGQGETDETVEDTGRIFYLTATGTPAKSKGVESLTEQKKMMFWDLNDTVETWHHLSVDLRALYETVAQFAGTDPSFEPDKFFIGLGTWNGIEPGSKTRVFFDNVNLQWSTEASASVNDAQPLSITDDMFVPKFIRRTTVDEDPLSSDPDAGEEDDRDDPMSLSRNDRIWGGPQDEVLHGKLGRDVLLGGGGDDKLVGGQGADTLNGYGWPHDRDRLIGRKGRDMFVLGDQAQIFYTGRGQAVIKDFSRHAGDKIQLHGSSEQYSFRYEHLAYQEQVNTIVYAGGDRLGTVRSHRVNLERDAVFV